ncbi:hypothetical protein Enr13x_02060 [Stieleria neptunia]|uniref:Uncharacterized protein n=1 Tax=Stieleria neptunia TaxID=2527979 RepID=A0A518HHV1_9BACT|nr:hypothetical protein [Stieleria neptunia]QDV40400.1 hypothetical protein Enr13x_02060 [Stieleria neptunia]
MSLRTFTFLASVAFFLQPNVASIADDKLPEVQSSENLVAAELDQHATDIRSIDRRFLDARDRLEQSYIQERKSLRETLVRRLNKQKKAHTEKGELDIAVAIRDHMERIEATEIVPPNQPSTKEISSGPAGSPDILGTWRWNNGVDIKNLVSGQTNGAGTWRLVDPQTRTYEFRWKRIPPDRVTLSPNGRVLEGTKAHDPSFRVWAVRID